MDELYITDKQAEYIRKGHHRWNFAVGAVRSGKSHLAIQYLIPQGVVERRGKKGINLILGATFGNIKRNVIGPMQDIWGTTVVSDIKSDGMAKIFGEPVMCMGADNKRAASRIRGSEVKFCYCDEITDINQETFEVLKSRLSLSYSICHAAANPSYPTHFIKEFIDSAKKGVDIYAQRYTLYDNPFLLPEYVSSLEAEYAGTVYYQRYILGRWAKAEGLVWPMYTEAFGVINGEPEEIVLSIDYGTLNPFACLEWKLKDGVWYADRGYYYSGNGTGQQKTDPEYADAIDEFMHDEIESRMIKEQTLGIVQPKIKVIIDPSAASFIELMRRKSWCRVIHANNDVLNGIRETATAMHKGLIKINPNIREWKQEVDGYVWDERKEDAVVKENDHYMDSTRYFVKTMNIVRQRNVYQPIWN